MLIRDAHDPADADTGLSMVRSRYRSMLAAPLKVAEGILGFVTVEAESPDAFEEGDLRALAAAARQAALALRNLRTLHGAREEARRLAGTKTGDAPPLHGEDKATLAIALNSFRNQFGGLEDVQYLMAVSLVTMVPCIVLFFVAYLPDSVWAMVVHGLAQQ